MAVSISDVQTELKRRNFPCFLTDETFQACADKALRELGASAPLTGYGLFTTVSDVQDYAIFDPGDTNTQGFAEDAAMVTGVWWHPSGDFTAGNIFAPGFQLFSQVILFEGNQFHRPSDMILLRQKLDQWEKQFGNQGWDVLGEVGLAASRLRIYPVPKQSSLDVVVEFRKERGLSDINSLSRGEGRHFMQWMEAFICEALANWYASTAGVKITGFQDSDVAYKHWFRQYEEKLKFAIGVQGGSSSGAMLRSM